MKTILVTGSSGGIGEEIVKLFSEKGWRVIATMRNLEKSEKIKSLKNVSVYKLDVNDLIETKKAISEIISKFKKIDVLVNNAGYALIGPFEASNPAQIEKQFQTNVFGSMQLIREILPHFRKENEGTIIQIASMGGRITFPLYSLYHASKWAVEGFCESLQYEVEDFNIRIKIIEPGPIKTPFYSSHSRVILQKEGLGDYDNFLEKTLPNLDKAGESGASPEVVARTVLKAANSKSKRLRYASDWTAKWVLSIRKLTPDFIFTKIIKLATISKKKK